MSNFEYTFAKKMEKTSFQTFLKADCFSEFQQCINIIVKIPSYFEKQVDKDYKWLNPQQLILFYFASFSPFGKSPKFELNVWKTATTNQEIIPFE